MNFYVINKKTLVIKPFKDKQSVIYELEKRIVINKQPLSIVKKSCYVNGSSYRGRVDGSRELTGYKYKLPLIIKESDYVIMFPTRSPHIESCEWISLNYIKKFYPNEEKNSTLVEFVNGLILELSVSCEIFKNQFLKANYLAMKIKQNK